MLGTGVNLYGTAPNGSYSVTVDGQTYPNCSFVGNLLYSASNLSNTIPHDVSLTLAINGSELEFYYAIIFIPLGSG
jgi:hypothetical protein